MNSIPTANFGLILVATASAYILSVEFSVLCNEILLLGPLYKLALGGWKERAWPRNWATSGKYLHEFHPQNSCKSSSLMMCICYHSAGEMKAGELRTHRPASTWPVPGQWETLSKEGMTLMSCPLVATCTHILMHAHFLPTKPTHWPQVTQIKDFSFFCFPPLRDRLSLFSPRCPGTHL